MGLTCMVEYTFGLSQGDPNGEVTVRRGSTVPTFTVFYTTKGDACVCVCVFAKLDQFMPVRSQFDSNQHVNSVRIATFQCANFGPLLFAFYCPLLFCFHGSRRFIFTGSCSATHGLLLS